MTPGVSAVWTSDEELGIDAVVTLEVRGYNVCEGGDEQRVVIGRCGSPDTLNLELQTGHTLKVSTL